MDKTGRLNGGYADLVFNCSGPELWFAIAIAALEIYQEKKKSL